MYARKNLTEWRTTVDRMRRFPGSAITPTDVDAIMTCLSYSAEAFVFAPSRDRMACQSVAR